MTHNKVKQQRLTASRLLRAKVLGTVDSCDEQVVPPPGAVTADPTQLVHNNTYGRLPRFYLDRVVVCRQCATEEVWPAERQKWWYEVAKGSINAQAVLCRACRSAEKERKDQAAGAAGKQRQSVPRKR
jgi:hypothetical protein